MREITCKNITFLVDEDKVWVKERDVIRTFKKSGTTTIQHYDTYQAKTHSDKKGYKRITVSKNAKNETFLLHNLIAMAYPEICGSYFEGCVVHHIDHNPDNNKPSNLAVLTKEAHSIVHSDSGLTHRRMCDGTKRHPSNFKGHKHTPEANRINGLKHSKGITQYTLNGEKVKEFFSACDAARITGFARSSIARALLSGQAYNGYIWRYV